MQTICREAVSEMVTQRSVLCASDDTSGELRTERTLSPFERTPRRRGAEQYVLIADADDGLAEQIATSVRQLGYRAAVTRTGHETLEVAQRTALAAAILDLGLPGVYGGTVAQVLRMQNPGLPIILLSSLSVLVAAEDAWHVHAYAYFTKPFDVEALTQTLSQALVV
jgi:DNA-binding NtrC family response regulator